MGNQSHFCKNEKQKQKQLEVQAEVQRMQNL